MRAYLSNLNDDGDDDSIAPFVTNGDDDEESGGQVDGNNGSGGGDNPPPLTTTQNEGNDPVSLSLADSSNVYYGWSFIFLGVILIGIGAILKFKK